MNRTIQISILVLALAPQAAAAAEPTYNHAPVTLWIAPHLGTAGLSTEHVETNFALSLGASAYARLQGLDLGAGASWVTESMRGAQITAGFNYAGADAIGVQLSAGANIAAESISGLQLGGGFNYGSEVTGLQLSLINIGSNVRGAQVGLVNVADVVEGTQVGLLNVANDSPAPLGLLNFVENGHKHLRLWSSESAPLNLGLELGGETIYSLLSVGFEASDGKKRWLAGLGAGVHIPLDERIDMKAELVVSHVNEDEAWTTDLNTLTSLRLLFGYEVHQHLSIFGGPTLNVMVSEAGRGDGIGLVQGFRLSDEGSDVTVRMWPGLVAGLEI